MAEAPCELTKQRFDYAWKWFAYHADQRVKLFNYMIIATGILAAGIGNALRENNENYLFAGILSVLGILFGIAFRQLDKRNSTLVWYGEDMLRQIERDCLFNGATLNYARTVKGEAYRFETPMGILNREATDINDLKSATEEEIDIKNADTKTFGTGSCDRAHDGKHRFWFPVAAFGIMGMFALLLGYTVYKCVCG